jgi:prophage antirepressor-like protein
MMNIQIFRNSKFGEVRVAEIEGKTYFVGNDVAKALGYASPKDAISRHCKGATFHRLPDSQVSEYVDFTTIR